MFVATLAISGIPPFAGFFSKDAILVNAFASGHHLIWGIGTFTAFLTAFYMFRLLFTVFHAPSLDAKELAVLPNSMTRPLVVLAFASATVGFLGVNEAYGGGSWFNSFVALPDISHHISHTTEYMLGALNVILGLSGMFLAYKMFALNKREVKEDALYKKVILNKFYVDEVYVFFIVKPLLFLSRLIANVIDPKVFDAFINFNVWTYRKSAVIFARLQNGKVRYYALYILMGVSIMSYYILFKLGLI
jgi:NADH-quinone oxidoreductase subunit L